jgi:hypothetical protein
MDFRSIIAGDFHLKSSAMQNLQNIRPLGHELHPYVDGEQPKIKALIKLNANEKSYPSPPPARRLRD